MKKCKILVSLLSLVFFVLTMTACQQAGAPGAEQLRGTITKAKDSDGYNFTAEGKIYQVEGQQDLKEMLGKFVKVEGTVGEKDGKRTITVASVKPEGQ